MFGAKHIVWVFRAGGTNNTVLAVKQKAMKEYPQYLHVQLDCFDIQTDKTTKEQLLLSGHGWKTTSLYVACYLQNLQWDCVSEWVSMVSWETQFCCTLSKSETDEWQGLCGSFSSLPNPSLKKLFVVKQTDNYSIAGKEL